MMKTCDRVWCFHFFYYNVSSHWMVCQVSEASSALFSQVPLQEGKCVHHSYATLLCPSVFLSSLLNTWKLKNICSGFLMYVVVFIDLGRCIRRVYFLTKTGQSSQLFLCSSGTTYMDIALEIYAAPSKILIFYGFMSHCSALDCDSVSYLKHELAASVTCCCRTTSCMATPSQFTPVTVCTNVRPQESTC